MFINSTGANVPFEINSVAEFRHTKEGKGMGGKGEGVPTYNQRYGQGLQRDAGTTRKVGKSIACVHVHTRI